MLISIISTLLLSNVVYQFVMNIWSILKEANYYRLNPEEKLNTELKEEIEHLERKIPHLDNKLREMQLAIYELENSVS